MNVTLIGLVGTAGSGKDTAAEALQELGFQKIAFADPIKYIAFHKMGWNRIKDERGRALLQDIGMAGRSYDPDTWIRQIQWSTPIQHGRPCVVTDVRFENEAAWVRKKMGILIRIVRPDLPTIQHVSETEQKKIECHYEVDNSGSIQDLHRMVKDIITSIQLDWHK